MVGIEELEEYGLVRRIQMFFPTDISLYCPEQNKKKPSESKTHMHIAKAGIRPEYLSVNKTLKEYLLKALTECPAEKSPLEPELVGS
jgi:hypothetical protein